MSRESALSVVQFGDDEFVSMAQAARDIALLLDVIASLWPTDGGLPGEDDGKTVNDIARDY